MKVKDIMVEKVISVTKDTKVVEIAKLLIEKRIHGVPVIEDNKVIGIITETDFFVKGNNNLYLPSFIEFMKKTNFSKTILFNNKKKKMKEIEKASAKDIMTVGCKTVSPEMELSEILNIFKATNFHTLPVVGKEGSLCGIITLADIISLVRL